MPKEELLNSNSVEIIGKNNNNVFASTIRGGFVDQKKVFKIKGRVKKNTPTIVGTLELTPSENNYVPRQGYLSPKFYDPENPFSSKLKLQLKKTTKDSKGHIVSYIYNLIYTGKENTSTSSMAYVFKHDTRKIGSMDVTSTTRYLREVKVGKEIIGEKGDSRIITFVGDPGCRVELAINKIEDSYNSDDEIVSSVETSELNKRITNATHENLNRTFDTVKFTINSSGKHSIVQKFPAVSSKCRHSINFRSQVAKTATDYVYGFEFHPPLKTFLQNNGWLNSRSNWDTTEFSYLQQQVWYSKIIEQVVNPVITLKATKTSSRYKINDGGTSDTSHSTTYRGLYNSYVKLKTNRTSIKYTCLSTTHSFAIKSASPSDGIPIFSNVNQTNSDWTNSVFADNGGTVVDITNIAGAVSTTTSSNDTFTLTFDIDISAYGTKSIDLEMNLDNVVVI